MIHSGICVFWRGFAEEGSLVAPCVGSFLSCACGRFVAGVEPFILSFAVSVLCDGVSSLDRFVGGASDAAARVPTSSESSCDRSCRFAERPKSLTEGLGESFGLDVDCFAAGLCIANLLFLECKSGEFGDGIGFESSTPEEWPIGPASMVVVDFARL